MTHRSQSSAPKNVLMPKGNEPRMLDQKQVVDALTKPEAYDEEPGRIELVQTHISFIFLTKDLVYKVKKAVDFGFLDFTTLEKRRQFCNKELDLNRRLCGDMYIEVVPINKSEIIKIKGKGKTIEYAVKMKRIPQETMLNRLLDQGKVDNRLIDQMARIIADFHLKAETNKRISKFGSLVTIEANWKENFEQTQEFAEDTISTKDFRLIQERIEGFMKRNESLFERRVAEERVRDCQGDIHSGNIFVADRIYIFDAIEFNERFRYSDVASDIAFLAMDLDFKGRTDLSDFLVKRYVAYSGDKELTQLLRFYKCYRAYVRGKVISFRLNDPTISDQEKMAAREEAKTYFKLAHSYARSL
jgi:aminoglycoside phosphotransferase family enzyme